MSYHVHARKVRDPERLLAHRLSSFRSCVQLYCWLIRRGFRETLDRFYLAFDLTHASERKLLNAIDALDAERRAFVQRLDTFARRRIRQKARGQRQPDTNDMAALYAPSFFVVPASLQGT